MANEPQTTTTQSAITLPRISGRLDTCSSSALAATTQKVSTPTITLTPSATINVGAAASASDDTPNSTPSHPSRFRSGVDLRAARRLPAPPPIPQHANRMANPAGPAAKAPLDKAARLIVKLKQRIPMIESKRRVILTLWVAQTYRSPERTCVC